MYLAGRARSHARRQIPEDFPDLELLALLRPRAPGHVLLGLLAPLRARAPARSLLALIRSLRQLMVLVRANGLFVHFHDLVAGGHERLQHLLERVFRQQQLRNVRVRLRHRSREVETVEQVGRLAQEDAGGDVDTVVGKEEGGEICMSDAILGVQFIVAWNNYD
jgi:hypothetical protein